MSKTTAAQQTGIDRTKTGTIHNWAEFLSRKTGGTVRMYPKVLYGSFMPVPRGSTPIRSQAKWAQMPGRTRKEKRAAFFALKGYVRGK